MIVSLAPSTRKDKKWTATLANGKRVHFGGKGYTDFTLNATMKQRDAYRARHRSGKSAALDTADALSYYILWGDSRNMAVNVKAFNKRLENATGYTG